MEKEDAYLCLLRIHHILKKKGIAYLQFPDFLSNHYFSLFKKYALEGSTYGARVRFYTKPEIETLLKKAGLQLMEYKQKNENIFVVGTKGGDEVEPTLDVTSKNRQVGNRQ
jgi:hypothetical protein